MTVLALLALVLLSAALVRVMAVRGVLDIPGHRSSHEHPTPKGGGIGIAAAFLVGLAGAEIAGLLPHQGLRVACLLAAALLIVTVAWLDDVRQFGFAPKLGAQFGAALLVVLGGWTISRIGPYRLDGLAGPLTLVWIVGVINAVNFIDGLNGLASGAVLIGSIATTLLAAGTDPPLLACVLLPLAAGIVGFLPFNFPRARVFMGDVGSQLCGLVIAVAAAPASRLAQHPWGAVVVPMALLPILADVGFTLIRRWRAGDRLTQAHRGHLYQLAHRSGVPAARITLVMWALTSWGALLGALASAGPAAAVVGCVLIEVVAVGSAGVLAVVKARANLVGRW